MASRPARAQVRRAEWHPGWPGRPIARCQIASSRIANGLLTASETSIIHSLARQLQESDQCLHLNGGLSVRDLGPPATSPGRREAGLTVAGYA
jgi:hypothetical protein